MIRLKIPSRFDESPMCIELEKAIMKLKNILEEFPEIPFNKDHQMILYNAMHNICTKKQPYDYRKELYQKYRDTFDEYLKSTVLPSLRDKSHECLLRELLRRWKNHRVMTEWLTRIFSYLERDINLYINRFELFSLDIVALVCFRDLAFLKVQAKATEAMISLIHKEREGEKIDRSLLKDVVRMYVDIGMSHYQDFQTHMLDDTHAYYERKAESWLEAGSCADYMIKVQESVKMEKSRVGDAGYLLSSTGKKLIERVQHDLLVTQGTPLFRRALLGGNKVEDISRMCRLYHEMLSNGLEIVADIFKKHVVAEGTTLVQQVEEASSDNGQTNSGVHQEQAIAVRKLIELHDGYVEHVVAFFMNKVIFHRAMKEAFEVICNKNIAGIPSAELFANFCENILKKGGASEKLSDEAIDRTLEKVVGLLVYINDKDLFAESCRKKLARRLLNSRSFNEDYEKGFLSKLKRQFGAPYTSKMEGMITDLVIARDNQTSFEEYLDQNPNESLGIDFSVTVLTTGYWPSYRSVGLNLPSEMTRCMEVFNGFYESKTNNRKLSWIFSLGTCNIEGKFQEKTIELVVSPHQAAALLLFNNADRLSFSEIMTQLGLGQEDVVRLLHSLSCAKYKILSKEPDTKAISPDDSFEFNSEFTDRMRRIKIPLPAPVVEKRKKVVEEVNKDRTFAVDAALVRILKSRKTLEHQQLVSECVELLSTKFKPDIKVIKKRIESLILRDFMERDPDDSNKYKYVA